MEVECGELDIQGCHRLPTRKGSVTKPVIIKFLNRQKAEEILSKQKKSFRSRRNPFEAYKVTKL